MQIKRVITAGGKGGVAIHATLFVFLFLPRVFLAFFGRSAAQARRRKSENRRLRAAFYRLSGGRNRRILISVAGRGQPRRSVPPIGSGNCLSRLPCAFLARQQFRCCRSENRGDALRVRTTSGYGYSALPRTNIGRQIDAMLLASGIRNDASGGRTDCGTSGVHCR